MTYSLFVCVRYFPGLKADSSYNLLQTSAAEKQRFH